MTVHESWWSLKLPFSGARYVLCLPFELSWSLTSGGRGMSCQHFSCVCWRKKIKIFCRCYHPLTLRFTYVKHVLRCYDPSPYLLFFPNHGLFSSCYEVCMNWNVNFTVIPYWKVTEPNFCFSYQTSAKKKVLIFFFWKSRGQTKTWCDFTKEVLTIMAI